MRNFFFGPRVGRRPQRESLGVELKSQHQRWLLKSAKAFDRGRKQKPGKKKTTAAILKTAFWAMRARRAKVTEKQIK